jgi:anti-sigma factor RsiW
LIVQRHVSGSLAALIDGQLTAAEAARVNAHLAWCTRCREARDRFQFAADMLNRLTRVEAPASIWTSIEHAERWSRGTSEPRNHGTLEPRNHGTLEPRNRGTLEPRNLRRRAFAMAAVLVLAAAGLVLWRVGRGSARWDVVRLDARGGEARMTIGEWVETDAASRATIRIGDIGTVDIAPNTRMQLLAARPDEHRLNLARGTINAWILAPPRLFFVETPSSTVVDLGCAYGMTVDQAGVGLLRVTSGWASLEWGGRESLVPAGAICPTRPSVGPGTPSFDDATERLREALLAFDFANGGSAALGTVLEEARGRDTLTLWHLLSRVEAGERTRIFDRMVALTPLPNGVTREKALTLDAETLKLWREELAWTW